jgi:DNA repair protein RadC
MSDRELIASVLSLPEASEAVVRLAEYLDDGKAASRHLMAVVADELPGIGDRKAVRMAASLELGRRWLVREGHRTVARVDGPEDIVTLVGPKLRNLEYEQFVAVLLNTKNHVLDVVDVSVGSLNAAIVHPRELYRDAVRSAAASIVVAHGHPSGCPEPSAADITLTHRLVKAGDVVGIELLDHVVIGRDDFVSIREAGLM